VTTSLLQTVKKLDGVVLAALFGSAIHVCGYDKKLIEKELRDLCLKIPFKWGFIKTTLEDTFISLVGKSKEP